MLILAGVSLNMIVGDNGVIENAKKASQKTELTSFVEEAGMAYAEIYSEKARDSETVVTMGDVVGKLVENYGYEGKIHNVTNGSVTGITASETEVNVTTGNAKTITINIAGGTTNYYVDIKDMYYPINMSTSEITLGEGVKTLPSGSGTTPTLNVSSNNSNCTVSKDDTSKTVTIAGANTGSSIVTVTYGGKTATINVTVNAVYAVTIQTEDGIKGTVSPNTTGQYESGDEITLRATSADGYKFSGWYNGETLISTENPHTYTVSGAITITGKFATYIAPDYTKLRNNSKFRNSKSKRNKLSKRLEILL